MSTKTFKDLEKLEAKKKTIDDEIKKKTMALHSDVGAKFHNLLGVHDTERLLSHLADNLKSKSRDDVSQFISSICGEAKETVQAAE